MLRFRKDAQRRDQRADGGGGQREAVHVPHVCRVCKPRANKRARAPRPASGTRLGLISYRNVRRPHSAFGTANGNRMGVPRAAIGGFHRQPEQLAADRCGTIISSFLKERDETHVESLCVQWLDDVATSSTREDRSVRRVRSRSRRRRPTGAWMGADLSKRQAPAKGRSLKLTMFTSAAMWLLKLDAWLTY